MSRIRFVSQRYKLVISVGLLAVALAGCGEDGDPGPAGPPGPPGLPPPSAATALNMAVTGVTINSAPVVDFSVTNQNGVPVAGLTTSDLRFNIAKLTPGSNGNPSTWQNYIVTTQNASAPDAPKPIASAVQGTRENNGALVDHGDGTYTYTFSTDITNVACPAPCQDAYGNPLDLSYNPNLTHRLDIQTRGALPAVNAVYTFRPADGATSGIFTRDIVKTGNCNECHNKLEAHDARIETRYCVTCHNPGSTDPDSGNTVDFKVLIHKLHRGENLPSVAGGGSYAIWGHNNTKHDFSDVVFPQHIRNCTKCHDGSGDSATNPRWTPQGDNWKTQPSMVACGSCHDDIDFSKDGAVDPNGHPGGIVTDNSLCTTCHAAGGIAGSIEEKHAVPQKLAGAKFKYNIVSVTGGATPSIQFSVTDPTNADAPYDITTDPAFTTTAGGLSRLAIDVAWSTRDFNNEGSGADPAQPISINPVSTCGGPGTPTADWSCTAAAGVYTLTKLTPLPASATGTGRIGMEGHPAAPSDPVGAPSVYDMRVPVTSVVADFGITDSPAVPRRKVVDVAKCDKCHDVLSLHGDNRVNEPQLCVICHNPNDTDVNRRPKNVSGLPDATVTLDKKKEEAIDFKRLIHGVHAAAQKHYDGTPAHGFREKGLVIYGFGSFPANEHDFSHVRFPGILNDCETCHLPGTYTLAGTWQTPTQNGILASTIDTAPNATDAATFAAGLATPADDLNITPTAAVCSSCHDSLVAQSHMTINGALFMAVQSPVIDANVESCAVCHGPGRDFDVDKVHAE